MTDSVSLNSRCNALRARIINIALNVNTSATRMVAATAYPDHLFSRRSFQGLPFA
jgi:hypothetical protein